MEVHLGKRWTTHIGVLTKVLQASTGDVIEFGSGPFSTPLLHWLCKDMNRLLISYENNPKFYTLAKQYRSNLNRIKFVTDWNQVDAKTHRGLVLIDHAPWEKQSIDIIRFKDIADYIVIHGTHREEYYIDIWEHFKYIYTWKGSSLWTSVVSNFKDLSWLESSQ
jgi:hypothetical protein